MNKLLFFLLLNSSLFFSQTSLTITGNVTNNNSEPLEAEITINQLVGNTWEYRGEGQTDANGEFDITVNNITSVTGAGLSSLNYSLQGNILYSPVKTKAEVIYYNLLGEEVSRQNLELLDGNNKLQFNLGSSANGIYIRSIHLDEGVITQKIVKQGRSLSYGTAGINRLNLNRTSNSSLKKVNSDSLYIMTIAAKEGFLSDTNITAVSKTNPSDISGLDLRLREDDNYIYVEMLYVSSLGEKRINEPVDLSIEAILDTTFYSNAEGMLVIELNLPKNSPRTATLTFPDYEDRLNTRVIHKQGTKLDQEPVAITDFQYAPNVEVFNTMQVNLDSLEKAYEQAELALFDFQRFYETNEYINNGVFDLNKIEHLSIFENGFNITWTAEKTDSLWFITSNINQNTGEPTDPNRQAQLDKTLNDMQKMLRLEGTGIEAYNRVKIAGIYKVDDINNNEIKDYLNDKYDSFNYADVFFSNSNGNGQITDNLRI